MISTLTGKINPLENLKQLTDSFDLKQLISGPTQISHSTKSQIDFRFRNRPERILKSFNVNWPV